MLYFGDCLQIMPSLADKSVDMVLCDLPYGITANKWDTPINLDAMWEQLSRICKDNAAMLFTASQPFTSKLVMSNPQLFKHEWIWIKNRGSNFANTIREPMKEHESILMFSRGKWTYNKQMQQRTGSGLNRVQYGLNFRSKSENYREFENKDRIKMGDLRVPSSWQKFNTEVGYHPTQKPILLCEYLIKTYTNEGDVVLDFTMGSGTTGVACKNIQRQFIGIELDPVYFNIAKERMGE